MRRSVALIDMASNAVGHGIFAINKPCGSSSAQVIRECQQHFNPSDLFKSILQANAEKSLQIHGAKPKRRRELRKALQVKIGHGGTLDPLATGVLILGIGSATKMLHRFLNCTKTYETTVLFGASTDTYDRVGRILTKRPYQHISKDSVLKELEHFRGKKKQMPPLYSALKMNGKPLYEYVREGKPIPRDIEARDVEALEIELVEWYEPGSHNHRWPVDQAGSAERNLAEQVWKVKKLQETSRTLTPEEKKEDDLAIAAHESFKRKFEERQDKLITDKPLKKRRRKEEPMMSGALGALPQPVYSTKGANLIRPSPSNDAPPPWSDEGPPACKIRLTVTSGYYIRSFCHDLGARLDSAAIMAELCRLRQSDFTTHGINTLQYEDLAKGEDIWGPKVAGMLARWNGRADGHAPETAVSEPKQISGGASAQSSAAESPPNPSQSHQPSQDHDHIQPVSSAPLPGYPLPLAQAEDAAEAPSWPPSKMQAATNGEQSPKPNSAESACQARPDDEKSWLGIDD